MTSQSKNTETGTDTMRIFRRLLPVALLLTQAAQADTLLQVYEKALQSDPQVREAQRHYRTRNEQLKFFAEKAEKARRVRKEPGPPIDPAELILSIIKEQSGPRGVHLDDVLKGTRREALADDIVRDIIRALVSEDEIYQPAPGYLKLL